MEDGAKNPRGEPKVGEELIVGPQRVVGRDEGAHFLEALPVRPEVADREEHGEGLLHAHEAVKGPFAVKLDNGEVGGDARAGDDVLASVVAFGGAVPEEEAAGQGWQILVSGWFARSCLFVFGGARERVTDRRGSLAGSAVFGLADLEQGHLSVTIAHSVGRCE